MNRTVETNKRIINRVRLPHLERGKSCIGSKMLSLDSSGRSENASAVNLTQDNYAEIKQGYF